MLESIKVREFTESDEPSLISLWETCGLTRPWNNPSLDIHRKLDGQRDWFLVATDEAQIVASVMVGYDGHRGWVNYLSVHPSHRKSGLGRMMMLEAETRLRAIGCPKINLQVRRDNLEASAFYEAIGFVQDDVVSFGKRLSSDSDIENESK